MFSRQCSDKWMLLLFPTITFVLFAGTAVVYWVIKVNPWQVW